MEEVIIESEEDQVESKSVPLSDTEVLQICKEDLETAKKAKTTIDDKITTWRDLVDGKSLGNEVEGRSKYVAKEAQKAVNWWIPNAIKPFMSANNIADFAPRTFDDMENAKSQNTLINYQFNNDFPKYQFLHTSLSLFATEGTIVARLGWEHEEEEEIIPFEGFTQQQVDDLAMQGAEINITDWAEVQIDPMESPIGNMTEIISKGTATITTTTVSRPDAEPIKNEDFFIIGDSIEDSDACIQRIDTNRSDLRKKDKAYNKNGIYENVDQIIGTGTDTQDSGLGTARQTDLENQGQVNEDDISGRDQITIYEYYGNIDIDNDGIAEPIVCVWSGNIILKIGPNPFPDEKPPFIGTPFMPIPFSFFGNGLPHYLEDTTKVKSAIMRTFIDLMANSTNGMKHVQKGSIDVLNSRRLKEAKIGTIVEWNDINGYQPEVHNEIPNSLQQMYELFTAEGENESGITRYNQGLDAKSLNKTATGITAIMNQSQMRTWETVTRFAEQFMKPLFRKWIAYNQKFLDKSIALRVVGDQYTEVSKDDIKGNFDLTVNVAIAGSEEQKAQKVIQMLQMITPMIASGSVPANHITKLVAELEELWGFKDLSQELASVAEAKQQAQTQALQQILSLPPEMHEQIVMMMQQQQGNPNQGIPNQ